MTSTTSATTAHDESDEDHRRQVTLLGACGDAVAAALQSAHALPGSTLSSSSATSLNRLSPGIPRTILEPKQHRHSDKLLIDTNAAPFEEKKEDHVLPMMMRDGRDGTVGELKNHNNMYATASPTPLEEGQEALWVEQPTTYQTVAPNSPDSTQSTGSSEASQQLRQKKRDKKKNKKKKNAGKDDVYVQPPPLVVPQQTVVLLLPPDHNPAAAAAVAAATATAAAPYTITSVHSGDRPSTRASATRLLETAMACDDPVTKQALVKQALQQALEARLRQLTTSNGTNSASPREAKQAKKQWTREYDEAFQALKTGRYEHVRDCLERLSPDDDVSTLGFDNTFDLPSPGGTTTHFHKNRKDYPNFTNQFKNKNIQPEEKKDVDVLSMSSLNEILDGPTPPVSPIAEEDDEDGYDDVKQEKAGETRARGIWSNRKKETTTEPRRYESAKVAAVSGGTIDGAGTTDESKGTSKTNRMRLIPRLNLFKKKDKEQAEEKITNILLSKRRKGDQSTSLPQDGTTKQDIQRFVATLVEDDEKVPADAPHLQKLHGLDTRLFQRLKEAIDNDGDESIRSLEGVPLFDVDEEKQKKMREKANQNRDQLPTDIVVQNSRKPKSFTDMRPMFIAAPRGPPEILTQKSWESLQANGDVPDEFTMDETMGGNETENHLDQTLETLPSYSPTSTAPTKDRYTVASFKTTSPEPDKYSVLTRDNHDDPCAYWNCLGFGVPHAPTTVTRSTMQTNLPSPESVDAESTGGVERYQPSQDQNDEMAVNDMPPVVDRNEQYYSNEVDDTPELEPNQNVPEMEVRVRSWQEEDEADTVTSEATTQAPNNTPEHSDSSSSKDNRKRFRLFPRRKSKNGVSKDASSLSSLNNVENKDTVVPRPPPRRSHRLNFLSSAGLPPTHPVVTAQEQPTQPENPDDQVERPPLMDRTSSNTPYNGLMVKITVKEQDETEYNQGMTMPSTSFDTSNEEDNARHGGDPLLDKIKEQAQRPSRHGRRDPTTADDEDMYRGMDP